MRRSTSSNFIGLATEGDAVTQQHHGNKPVIYLDQNWISEITKAHLSSGTSMDRCYYLKLSHVIQQGVAQDKFVCPTSNFHESESTRSFELNTDLRSVDNTLSRGLSFNSHLDISHDQMLQAASAFAGVDFPSEHWWRIPFNRDPDTPDSVLPRSLAGLEVFLTSYEMVDEERRVRNQVSAPTYQTYKDLRKGFNLSYPGEVEFSMRQLFRESYVALDEAIPLLGETPPGWDAFHWMTALQQQQRLMEIKQICDKGDGFNSFFSSVEFSDAPFLSVRAKLMAADIVHESRRTPEPSLLDDFNIVATILPYSHVFATENYIAELTRKTKVGDDHGCRVFTMRQRHEFIDFLSAL